MLLLNLTISTQILLLEWRQEINSPLSSDNIPFWVVSHLCQDCDEDDYPVV